MANIGFTKRFPHFGIFVVIAVALAIPLTVWSLNNVSTNTSQHAATTCTAGAGVTTKKCTGTGSYAGTTITCGKTFCDGSNGCSYHSWNCSTTSTGYPTCGTRYTHLNSKSCGYTAPSPTPTPVADPAGYNCNSNYTCSYTIGGKYKSLTDCTTACKTPVTPTPTPVIFTCGLGNSYGTCPSGKTCVNTTGSSQFSCVNNCGSNYPSGYCPSGQTCSYDAISSMYRCAIMPTPTPIQTCESLGGTCYGSISCPTGTSILQKCIVSGSTSSGICCK